MFQPVIVLGFDIGDGGYDEAVGDHEGCSTCHHVYCGRPPNPEWSCRGWRGWQKNIIVSIKLVASLVFNEAAPRRRLPPTVLEGRIREADGESQEKLRSSGRRDRKRT